MKIPRLNLRRFNLPRLVLVLTAVLMISPAPVSAQNRTIFDAFRSIFQPSPPPGFQDTAKPRKPRKPHVSTPRPARPRTTPTNPVMGPPMPGPVLAPEPAKPSFYVQVLGDSLGLLLAQGLADALSDRPEISVVKKARESSGLVRDDFLDWPKTTRDLLASAEQTDIAVLMLGSNDHQPFLKDGKILADIGSDEWTRLYRERALSEANLFKDKHIKLLWVGMPIMRSDKFSAEMSKLNEVYRDVAGEAGASFIDVWQVFTDDKGQFSATGPDINGQPARLRTSDGIHLTKAGQRKLASFVEKDIRRAFEAKKTAPDLADLPPPDKLVEATPAMPGSAMPPLEAKPAEPEQPAMPVKVERPISGETINLTAPPAAPNGEFVATLSSRQPLSVRAAPAADEHPGRTDDFSWPQN